MQSDLASSGPSCVREHFRGWRNILFANIVAQAREEAETLYLCRAEDVARACFRGIVDHQPVSPRWKSIYDLTAAEWGMRLVRVREPVNMQIYNGLKPVWSQYFFELPLNGQKQVGLAEQELQCTEIL